MKNKNSSPPDDERNYQKNAQLIAYEIENRVEIQKILDILEDKGLISDVLFDRLDTNTDQEHYHFYYNAEINHNTISKMVNDYIKYAIVDENRLEKERVKMENNKTLRLYGVLENRIVGFGEKNDKIKKLIANTDYDMIFFLGQDVDGIPVAKPFNTKTGIKPKPKDLLDEELMKDSRYHTLQGRYDFTYTFNRNVDTIRNIVAKTKESVLEAIGDKYDTSLINLKVSVFENELRVAFNNLLRDKQNPEKLYMISSKNMNFRMGGIQEKILKKLADRLNLKINTQKVAIWKDRESRRVNLEFKLRQENKQLNTQLKQVDKEIPKLTRKEQREESSRSIEDKTLFDSKLSAIKKRIEENREKLEKLEDVKDLIDVQKDIESIQEEIQKDEVLEKEVQQKKNLYLNRLKKTEENGQLYPINTTEILTNRSDLDFMQEVKSLTTLEEVNTLFSDIRSKISKLEEVKDFADVSSDIQEWREKLSIVSIVKVEKEKERRDENKLRELKESFEKGLQERDAVIETIREEIIKRDKTIQDLMTQSLELEKKFEERFRTFASKEEELLQIVRELHAKLS